MRVQWSAKAANEILNRLGKATRELQSCLSQATAVRTALTTANPDGEDQALRKAIGHFEMDTQKLRVILDMLQSTSGAISKAEMMFAEAEMRVGKLAEDTRVDLESSLLDSSDGSGGISYEEFIRYVLPFVTTGMSFGSPVLSTLLPFLNPLFAVGGMVSNPDTASGSSSAGVYGDWLGYELTEGHPGITAYIGKAGAEVDGDWGGAKVNAYIGKATAEAEGRFRLFRNEEEREYRNGEWKTERNFAFVDITGKVGASVSVLSVDGDVNLGDEMLGLDLKGEGIVGSARAEATGTIKLGEKGIDAYVKGEAVVAATEGEVEGSINILGFNITGSIGGYAGAAGVEGEFGFKDGKFVMRGGAAALFGVKGGIEIGVSEEAWDGFVDFLTFWD